MIMKAEAIKSGEQVKSVITELRILENKWRLAVMAIATLFKTVKTQLRMVSQL